MSTGGLRKPGPGWFPDPEMADTLRYWDGNRWTDQVAPRGPAATVKVPSSPNVLWLGRIMAVFFPIAGLLIGLSQLNRSTDKALVIIAVSIGVMVVLVLYQLNR